MKTASELKLGEAAVVGRKYLVPCMDITGLNFNTWSPAFLGNLHLLKRVPVIGTVHQDPEFPGAGGEKPHIHVDTRFMNTYHMRAWGIKEGDFSPTSSRIPSIPIVPPITRGKYPDTSLHVMVCRRETPNHATTILAGDHYEVFEDKMEGCSIKLDHPICPHQGTPLGGIAPTNGLIHCPTHGLGFCPLSGKMVRKTKHSSEDDRPKSAPPFPSAWSTPALKPGEEREASCS